MRIQNTNFNIEQIAESGQCFRMNRLNSQDNTIKYSLIAYGRYLELSQIDGRTIELSCSEEEYREIWEEYFDMNYNYSLIVGSLINSEDKFLREAAEYGYGIRILKQEPFEAMISFIISQNKNIPAIKNCIEDICERYGNRIEIEGKLIGYSFPTPQALAMASKEDLRSLKTGYRDEYIIRASHAVDRKEINLEQLKESSFEKAVMELKKIHGIGEKVANCIALYGLHHIEGFPVDVWILRVIQEIYQNDFDKNRFKGYAGIVQQYMFYYMRFLKGVK